MIRRRTLDDVGSTIPRRAPAAPPAAHRRGFTMLETISKGFRSAKAKLTGQTELTADNIEEALRDVRMSLLEADVEFKVTKRFLERVKEKAIGQTVELRAKAGDRFLTATPDQHFVKICQEVLTDLMGP